MLGFAGRTDAFTLLRGNGDPPTTVGAVFDDVRRWPAPNRFGDASGLGGGITYALDEKFCEVMIPRFLEEAESDALFTLGSLIFSS